MQLLFFNGTLSCFMHRLEENEQQQQQQEHGQGLCAPHHRSSSSNSGSSSSSSNSRTTQQKVPVLSRLLLSHGIQLPFLRPKPPSLPILRGKTRGVGSMQGRVLCPLSARLSCTAAEAHLHVQSAET